MSDSSITDELLEELRGLREADRRRVLEYARSLSERPPEGVSGESLLAHLGSIPADDAEEIATAIEEGCEQVNLDAWSGSS